MLMEDINVWWTRPIPRARQNRVAAVGELDTGFGLEKREKGRWW